MVYTAQTTTIGTRSSLKKVMTCLCAMLLLAWGNVWAADKTVSSAEIYEGDYTVNAGETLKITSTGTFTITGNLINNGGTIIVDGGTLEIGGNVENTSQYKDGEWTNSGSPNSSYSPKNPDWGTTYVTEGTISTGAVSPTNQAKTKGTQTQTQTGTPTRARERTETKTQTQLLSGVYCEGSITVKNGGKFDVERNFTNNAKVAIETVEVNKISSISIKGKLDNSCAMVSYVTQQRTETTETKQTQTSTNNTVSRKRSRNVTRNDINSAWVPNDDESGYGNWSNWSNWSMMNWSNSDWTPSEPSTTKYSEPSNKTTDTKTSIGFITLDNGYLVVNGDVTLEDKTTINFNQSTKNLKSQVDGNDIVVVSTFLVKGDLIQNETAQIQYGGDNGMLVVSGNIDDKTGTADDSVHPWTFTKDGTKSVTVPVDGFVLMYGSYAKEKKDVETIQEQINKRSNNLESLKYLYNTWDELGTLGRIMYIAGLAWVSGGTILFPSDVKELMDQVESDIKDLEQQKKLAEEYNLDVAGMDAKELEKKLEEIASLLPITLNYFVANQDGDEVAFEWQTSSEVNNDFFTVEYSIDGVHFKELLREDGNGTTSETNNYYVTASAEDFSGITYFRLKQTDFNGEYSYSSVISLMVEAEETNVYVYPNPATEFVSVSGTYNSALVKDVFGKTVLQASNNEQIYVGNLSAGTYYVVITTANGKKVLPFVKK